MIKEPIQYRTAVFLGVLSVLFLLGVYTYMAHRQHVTNPNDSTIPTWSQIKDGVISAVEVNKRSQERWIVQDAKATGGRLFLGMVLGIAASVVLGLLMGCVSWIEAILLPPLAWFAKVPGTAALPLFFVLVGTDTNMYVTMIVFGVLPSLAQSVCLAVKDVPRELLFKAYTLGATHVEVVWNIIFRHILPKLIDAVRLQIGPAMVYLVAAEMLVGDVGFGSRIRMQWKIINMSVVYPYLAILATFGFLADYGLRQILKTFFPWAGQRH